MRDETLILDRAITEPTDRIRHDRLGEEERALLDRPPNRARPTIASAEGGNPRTRAVRARPRPTNARRDRSSSRRRTVSVAGLSTADGRGGGGDQVAVADAMTGIPRGSCARVVNRSTSLPSKTSDVPTATRSLVSMPTPYEVKNDHRRGHCFTSSRLTRCFDVARAVCAR